MERKNKTIECELIEDNPGEFIFELPLLPLLEYLDELNLKFELIENE